MKNKPEEERSLVAFFAHQKDTPDFLQKYWLKSNEELKANKIKRKAITTFSKSIQKYLEEETMKKFNLEMKALSEKIIPVIFPLKFTIISHRSFLIGISREF